MEIAIALLLAALIAPMSAEYLLGAGMPALERLLGVAMASKDDPKQFEQKIKTAIEPPLAKKMFWWPSVITLGTIIGLIFATGSHFNFLGSMSLIGGPIIVIIAAVVLEEAPFDSPALWALKLRKKLVTRYLAGSKNPDVHQFLLKMIKKRSLPIWKEVVEQIAAHPRTDDIPLLDAGAGSPDRDIASVSVRALLRIAPKHLNNRVKHLLKVSRKGVVRAVLLENIHKLDPPVAELLLEKSRSHQARMVRDKVQVADQVMLTRQILDTLQEKIEDVQYQKYLTALRKLKKELSSGTWQSVQAARLAVEGYDTYEDWQPILKDLQLHNEPALLPVIRQLEKLSGRKCLNAVLGLAVEEDKEVQKLVTQVLRDRKDLKQRDIEKLLRAAQVTQREVGVGLISRLPEDRQVPSIFKALADKVISVRVGALRSMKDMKWRKEFFKLLEKTLRGNNQEVLKVAFGIAGDYGKRDILPALFSAYDNWEGRYVKEQGNYYFELKEAIDTVLTRESTFSRHSPLLYCPNCISRTKPMKIFEWKIPVCKVCEEYIFLESGVKAIAGVIGPQSNMGPPHHSVRVCGVWDSAKKRVTHQEIDVLYIVGGGNFDYDWALSAVMELLEKRRNEKEASLPIKLISDPPLSLNSKTIVKEYTSRKEGRRAK